MFSIIDQIRTAARKRVAYNRTVAELSSLPLHIALDLDIYQGDAHAIARKAVYGA